MSGLMLGSAWKTESEQKPSNYLLGRERKETETVKYLMSDDFKGLVCWTAAVSLLVDYKIPIHITEALVIEV